MQKIIRYTLFLLLLWIVSLMIANILLPAFHPPSVSPDTPASLGSVGPCTERILCIDDNEEALLWRLRMIANARESIVLSTFDLRSDESGKDIQSALFMAAERGVKVQLLIDGIYEPFYLKDSELFHALCSHENVDARFYNPIRLKNIYKVNYRMHDKYLIIDNRMYLLGGRNTNDIFLGDYQEGINIDRDILVYETIPGAGSSYLALQEYFTEVWNSSYVEPAAQKLDPARTTEHFSLFRERYEQLRECSDFEDYDDWENATIEVHGISLLSNPIHTGNKNPRLLDALKVLAAEGSDIQIQTPYIICDSYMYQTLSELTKQADLKILINAVERGSNPFGCTDYLNNQKKIRSTGVTIYELMNEHAVHTKTILIDDHLSIVGSYNLDMRSTYLDTELMLVIDSPELNAHLRRMNEVYIQKSLAVQPDGTETLGPLYQPLLLSNSKTLFYDILKIVIRPFRHLL